MDGSMKEKSYKGKPLVHWKSSKPNPYIWPHLLVELGTINDPCGCRRARLREHDKKYKSRWVMYYEAMQDAYERDIVDPRFVHINDEPRIFVVKVYADMNTLAKNIDLMERRMAGQNKLTAEFVWVLRPCETHGKKMTDGERRQFCWKKPAHLIHTP